MLCFFFFNDTATTEIYTLSLHDALPISASGEAGWRWTAPPQGQSAAKKMGPVLLASRPPTDVGRWSGILGGPTGYKVVWRSVAQLSRGRSRSRPVIRQPHKGDGV